MSSVGTVYQYAKEQKGRSARSSMDAPRSSAVSPAGTARSSTEEPRSSTAEPRAHKSSGLRGVAQKAIQAVKQHHKDVNSAFDAVYGTHFYTKDGSKAAVRS